MSDAGESSNQAARLSLENHNASSGSNLGHSDGGAAMPIPVGVRLLRSTENVWETIWEQRDAILEAVIASGQITAMDAARFRNDRNEWEAELKHIWTELQKEAATLEKSHQ